MKLTENIYLCGSGAFGLSPQGDCHCYVLDAGDELALIDCGFSNDPSAILRNMEADGLDTRKLTTVLLTHAHHDHVNGCAWLRQNLPVQIAASAFEAQALQNGLLETLGLQAGPPALDLFYHMPRLAADKNLRDGDVLQIGSLCVTALLTPGHSPGSMCYEVKANGFTSLFAGDTVFYKGFISLLAPPFSDYAAYPSGLQRLSGRGIDGLFPSHLMWTLRGGQAHIDTAIRNFTEQLRPELKPFS